MQKPYPDLLDRMLDALKAHEATDGCREDLAAVYPSADWGVLAWSYRLLKDLLLWRDFISGITATSPPSSRLPYRSQLLLKLVLVDRFSYHGDASRKIYLRLVLRARKQNTTIYIPECGPCGFEILPAFMAGYEKVYASDINDCYVSMCTSIWQGFPVSISTVDSNEFFRSHIARGADVLLPDWGHHVQSIGPPANDQGIHEIRYSSKNDLFYHRRRIRNQDFIDFFREVQELRGDN